MNTYFNHSEINNSTVDMYIIPAKGRHFYDPDFILEDLNFTWFVTNFEDMELQI